VIAGGCSDPAALQRLHVFGHNHDLSAMLNVHMVSQLTINSLVKHGCHAYAPFKTQQLQKESDTSG